MSVYYGNVKGIDILQAPRGMNNGGIALVTFDLVNQAQSGVGTDSITLGGGGYDQEVSTTQTLAQMIAARIRNGGTVTIDYAMPSGMVGSQAGNNLFAVGTLAVSGGNVTTIGIATAIAGAVARTTTSATWDAAAGIIVAFHDSVAQ